MSVAARAFFYIQQLEQLVRRRLDDCLLAEDLTAGQYMVLSLVAHHEPVSSSELARRTNVTAQSMGEYVKTLEDKGFIKRREDPANRRVNLVSTTPVSRKLLLRCETRIDQAERDFFACLSPEDMAQLRFLMSRVRSAQFAQRAKDTD